MTKGRADTTLGTPGLGGKLFSTHPLNRLVMIGCDQDRF
jgi:hypothetical protein